MITLSLGIDNGHGGAETSIAAKSFGEVTLIAQFENRSNSTQWIADCVDGSLHQMRFPHYDLEGHSPEGRLAWLVGPHWCGCINALSREDFIRLDPGEFFKVRIPLCPKTFMMPWIGDSKVVSPGEYELRLRYSVGREVKAYDPERVLDEELKDSIDRIWKGTLESNHVRVKLLPR